MMMWADRVRAAVAVVGLLRLAVGGIQMFRQWRRVRDARVALEGGARLDAEAERVATALQRHADDAIARAEALNAAERVATPGPPAPPSAATPEATGPAPHATPEPVPATAQHPMPEESPAPAAPADPAPAGPAPSGPSASAGHTWDGINDETRAALRARPRLAAVLEDNPLAAEALKYCHSVCYPIFASEEQVIRLEQMMRAAEESNIPVNIGAVRRAMHAESTVAGLDRVMDTLERGISSHMQITGEFAEAGGMVEAAEHLTAASIDEGFHLTAGLRATPGVASGGRRLTDSTRLLPDGRVGAIPGQIARRMRGMHFRNFSEFRETFWQLVANVPVLNQGWRASNLTLMRSGRPPRVGRVDGVYQATGGGPNAVLQLNHRLGLANAGGLYDLDNLEVVTPWFHQRIGD